VKLSALSGKPLTYTEVGATAGPMPPGYHHLRKSSVIGRGRDRFDEAAAAGMRWGMLRGAGLRVEATTPVAEVGAEVVAFSRHATWWSRLGSPVTSLMQRLITDRYLKAL